MRILISDEVLADFNTPALQVVFEETGKRFRPGIELRNVLALLTEVQREAVLARCAESAFFVSVLPQPGALKALEELRRTAEVVAVVADAAHAQWLVSVAGFAVEDIVLCSDGLVRTRGDVFVDVDAGRLCAWKARAQGGKALLWQSQPVAFDACTEPCWLPVCDWQVVRWFVRGARETPRAAACV